MDKSMSLAFMRLANGGTGKSTAPEERSCTDRQWSQRCRGGCATQSPAGAPLNPNSE